MAQHCIQATTIASAVLLAAGSLGLAACGSEAPESVQYPAGSSSTMRLADRGSEAPPPPPQPSHEPTSQRQSGDLPTYDGTLVAMVQSAIKAEPELNHLDIDVSAVEGTVYLRGEARTRETRRLASEVASSVDGVKRVRNELFVVTGSQLEERPSTGSVAAAR